ncbi:MAG: flagellar hook capping FlgD N-terminal domain-containing protein [Bryobacteraceae bacterium]
MGSIAASVYQQADAAGAAQASANANANSGTGTNGLDNTSAFLQLLVAQLKNQDPTQPVDPTTFVTQLAEFNDVEENMGSKQDLDAMSEQYLGVTTPPSAITDTTDGTDSTDGTSGTNSASGASGTGS